MAMQNKNQNVFLNSWPATILFPFLSFVFGFLLWLLLTMMMKEKLPDNPTVEQLWTIAWAVFWLWLTEGIWFALTCRRFAQKHGNKWLLFGAFGRVRYRFKAGTPCDYREIKGEAGSFLIWEENGAVRRFNLTMCANGWGLVNAIKAKANTSFGDYLEKQMKKYGLRSAKKTSRLYNNDKINNQLKWYRLTVKATQISFAVMLGMMLLLMVSIIQNIRTVGEDVWKLAAVISLLLYLPPAVIFIKYEFSSSRPLNRYPKHIRHWRLYMEEVRFHFITVAIGLFGLMLVTFSCATCLAMFSLWNQPWHDTYAQVAELSGKCNRRQGNRNKVKMLFPEYADFNGKYCLRENVREGEYRHAEVQSSKWARRVRFGDPYQPK